MTTAEDFEYELTWEREMWATGRGRRNDADDSWTMTMTHASLSRTLSFEAERAAPKAPKACEVSNSCGRAGERTRVFGESRVNSDRENHSSATTRDAHGGGRDERDFTRD